MDFPIRCLIGPKLPGCDKNAHVLNDVHIYHKNDPKMLECVFLYFPYDLFGCSQSESDLSGGNEFVFQFSGIFQSASVLSSLCPPRMWPGAGVGVKMLRGIP